MSKLLTVNYDEKPIYDIMIEQSFDLLSEKITALGIENKKICIITDSNVEPLYLDKVKAELSKTSNSIFSFTIPAGEANKNLKTVESIYEYLIINHFDRKDFLLALGGGVVGDITGYAAASYLRGISFIQVPTTLLAQVDSSIGGKTGVDFNCYKNMVGAFHMPKLVYINLSTLLSLDERLFNSGLGEIIKHGFIKDAAYYTWLKNNVSSILSKDMATLEEMIHVSCNIKRLVVEKDPKEMGERALLNFGHTLGHAIENLSNFSLYHGECVVLGCICALKLSAARGLISDNDVVDAVNLFTSLNFPVNVSGMTADDILKVSKNDKKMESGKIKFILLDGIGNGIIDKTVTDDEIIMAAKAVINE